MASVSEDFLLRAATEADARRMDCFPKTASSTAAQAQFVMASAELGSLFAEVLVHKIQKRGWHDSRSCQPLRLRTVLVELSGAKAARSQSLPVQNCRGSVWQNHLTQAPTTPALKLGLAARLAVPTRPPVSGPTQAKGLSDCEGSRLRCFAVEPRSGKSQLSLRSRSFAR